MVKRFSRGERSLCFGLRHYWDKKEKDPRYWPSEFRTLHLGITMNICRGMISSVRGRKLDSYYFGINFLYLKIWICFTIYNRNKNGN